MNSETLSQKWQEAIDNDTLDPGQLFLEALEYTRALEMTINNCGLQPVKPSDDPKCILITTNDKLGFQEMSGMSLQIERLVRKYDANYTVQYQFKSALNF